ncbi:DUF2891 domain-containing protein [Salinigranum rubrum]|uniref:DUF2891 domain-containing protein n=1 Tax=Salinigranum rubrum TaxID=755307 RepID=A0A2I8VK41_9EURY|nr:DUF2891 domain-containing protein [Salinigranum rubrum]AUV82264.1 DUF2891 domain-containing protein [Salinigranum rubrum]
MVPFDEVDRETLLSGRRDWMDSDHAAALSRHPLDCLETEYPHYVGAVGGSGEAPSPKRQHPVFYGCFDWHSAVHSHWCLIRQLRLFEDHPDEAAVTRSISGRFTAANVEREVEYLDDHPSFERPYGWAWLLRLAAELHLWDDERADEWRAVLRPLEQSVVDLVRDGFLSRQRPIRVGTHHNSAFALQCVLDYAAVTGADGLAVAARERSRAFFEGDRNYPVEYEPMGFDFLSPALAEADLMRRVLDREAFVAWVDEFLPELTEPPYDGALDPVEVDPESADGSELHLVGLNLSKAWCLAGVGSALGDHRYATAFERSAERHAVEGLERAFTDDYAGAHWLSSFVLYLLTRNEGGVAPVDGRPDA